MNRPVTDLADLLSTIADAHLPVPYRIDWSPEAGLDIGIAYGDVNAWFAVATGTAETAKASTEDRMQGHVFWKSPRLLGDVPMLLRYHIAVDEKAWAISNTSRLSYEEALGFLADWADADEQQRAQMWIEAHYEQGVPAEVLPECPEREAVS